MEAVAVAPLTSNTIAANGHGFKQFDILQMKKDRNTKWQIALKPMLSTVIFGGLFKN